MTVHFDLVTKIIDRVGKMGGPYSKWYCGITDDPDRRLKEHNIIKSRWGNEPPWLSEDLESEVDARDTEGHLVDELGFKGGGGGGGSNTTYVYVYKITPGVTNEQG